MFEMINWTDQDEITLFSDATLQKMIYEFKDYVEVERNVIPAQRRLDVSRIFKGLDEIDKPEQVLETIQEQRKSLEEKNTNLSHDFVVQNELISETEKMIKDARVSYTRAVVTNNNHEIDQIENKIREWSANITHAKIRKQAYQETRDFIASVLKPIIKMEARLKRRLARLEIKELRGDYREVLLQFAGHFKIFREKTRAERFLGLGNLDRDLIREIHKELGI